MGYVYFTEEQKERANTVDLKDFLERQGERLLRSGPEWRMSSDHSITIRGNRWYDHGSGGKGGAAIDFVIYYYGKSFPDAVSMLLGGEQGETYRQSRKQEEVPRGPFTLPAANENMRRVFAYLLKNRMLDYEVVSAFAEKRLIYESLEPSKDGSRQYHNAIFVGYDLEGKTSLAAHIAGMCDCNVIHLDHFFLRPEQRTAERLQQAGGNVDYERFLKEVLIPLHGGRTFSYRPWDCHKQMMGEAILIPSKALTIVEGSYSCHPFLKDYYDLSVFLSVDAAEQIRRIRQRNGEAGAQMFQERWIPMEEHYFHSFHIQKECDLYFQT